MKTSTLLFKPDKLISFEILGRDVDKKHEVAIAGKTMFQTEIVGNTIEVEASVTVFVEKITLKHEINSWSPVFEGEARINETDFKCTLSKNQNDNWELKLEPMEPEVKEKSVAITDPAQINIKPSDIIVRASGAVGNFGKAETEIAAARLLDFLKVADLWEPFTKEYLAAHYTSRGWNKEEILFGLFGPWGDQSGLIDPGDRFIIEVGPGVFAVTKEFILNCAGSVAK